MLEVEQEEMADEYVKWEEGARLLGVRRSSFFYLVETRGIRTRRSGPRSGTYHLEDIERVKRERELGIRPSIVHRKGKATPVFLDWLSPRDIPAILRLDQQVYDQMFLAEMARYQQWSEKNGQLAIAAFDARSNREVMLAYVACLPLAESVIQAIMRGERDEISLTADEIRSYEHPGEYTLLANSAVVHPDHPLLLYRVLHRMTEEWVTRFPERYVSRVYAQGISERGDLLISTFFMQPRYDLAPNAYMLDLKRPARAKLLRAFQERLKAKDPDSYTKIYQKGEQS